MINRSLIRIKTVQILYSYLLTRKDFKLDNPPAAADASPERLFTYSVYLDFLVLLLKLSGIALGSGSGRTLPADAALKKNRVGEALRIDPAMVAALAANRKRLDRFDSCLDDIYASVTATTAYDTYRRKRKLSMADDVAFWNNMFATVIARHKGVERVLRRDENFSHLGLDTALKMLTDTLLSFDDTRATYLSARTALDKSLSLAYDLYHALLILPVYLVRLQDARLDEAKHKYLPTPADLNPNMRFVDNKYVKALQECTALNDYVAEHPDADPANWRDSDILFASLLELITASPIYKDYMETEGGDFATDAAFWRELTRFIIVPSDELADALESKAVYWNDDLDIISSFVVKTMRRSYAGPNDDADDTTDTTDDDTSASFGKIELLPKFMNDADEAFGIQLFEYVAENREKYRELIDSFIDIKQWDTDRLAFMDIVILLTAIAEIVNFPSIPVPVTMNEYIEIANDYSTPRSGAFVNGMLYAVVKKLVDDGIIDKKL